MHKSKRHYFIMLIPIVFFLIGISINCFPIFLDLNRMPGDFGDARLINYMLEHSFLWLTNAPLHQDFFSPPVFWPLKDTLAYSDILIGEMLIYCPIRFLINNPQNAFQAFFLVLNIFNFSVFYFFLRKIFKLEVLFASIGAFFFAFNLPRYAQSNHIQLLAQFYMILPIFFLCLIKSINSKIKNRIYFTLACFSFVLLTYTTFYQAWSLTFGILLGLLILFSFKDTRDKLLEYFKNYDIYFIIPFVLSVLLLSFLAYKYLQADIKFFAIFPVNLLDFLFSFSFFDFFAFKMPAIENDENMLGVGILTQIFIIYSIFKNKYKKHTLVFLLLFFIIFTNDLVFNFLYDNVKLFATIRAYGRVVFLLIPIFSIYIAFFFKEIKHKRFLLISFLMLFILEQIPFPVRFNWTKSEHINRIQQIKLDDNCKAVNFITFDEVQTENINYALDIMWYANENVKYSSSGYSTRFAFSIIPLPKECTYMPK